MENFEYHNPVKLIFGKNVIDQIEKELHWKRAVILIGKGSVKRNGLYARILSILNMTGLEHLTIEGISANPLYEDADRAVHSAKEFGAEAVIAIGGGSVIDTAKAVSVGYFAGHSVWDFYLKKAIPQQALPVINILTMAACGTEMNNCSVLQDSAAGLKKSFSSTLLFPKVSFLDPSFTLTLPANYTAYGIANLISRCLEHYFTPGDAPLADHTAAAMIKLAIEHGYKAMINLEDYDARANLMWLSVNTLNGSLSAGKRPVTRDCLLIERSLSVLYNVRHGAGLSVIYPAWLKHNIETQTSKFEFLARQVFNITSVGNTAATEFISQLQQFFAAIRTPLTLSELNILPNEKPRIIENIRLNAGYNNGDTFAKNDVEAILDGMW